MTKPNLQSFLLSALISSLSNLEGVIYPIWTSAFSVMILSPLVPLVLTVFEVGDTGTQRHSLAVAHWAVPGEL